MPEVLCVILPGKPLCMVCQKKHKEGTRCSRVHEVPPNALWSGTWPKEYLGDLKREVKWQRKWWRKSQAKAFRKIRNAKSITPAPAFRAYHQSLIESLKKEIAPFQFVAPKK